SRYAAGLRSLRLAGASVRAEGAAALAASPYLGRLRRLELVNAGVEDDGAAALAASARLGSLLWLGLAANRVGGRGAAALAATRRFRLAELNLWHNPLGADGVRALAGGAGLAELTRLSVGNPQLDNCDELLACRLPALAVLEIAYADLATWRAEVLASA